MENRDDEQFESYLKQFRPLAAEPLPHREYGHALRGWWRLAAWTSAAAALAAAMVFAIYLLPRHPPSPQEPAEINRIANSQPLTIRTANELLMRSSSMKDAIDRMAFQSQVSKLSQGKQSALAVLSKDNRL